MPAVSIDIRELSGLTPGVDNLKDAVVWFYPFRPYGAPQLVTTDKLVVDTVDGVGSTFLPETPAGNGVYVEIRRVRLPESSRKFIVAIPGTDCNLFDLPHLDPATLDPEAPLDPAWLDSLNTAVPLGGTTGQVLAKASDADHDDVWVDQTGGGGGGAVDSVNTKTGVVVLDTTDLADFEDAVTALAGRVLVVDNGDGTVTVTVTGGGFTLVDNGDGTATLTLNGQSVVIGTSGGGVPTTRTVNGHALSADVTVTKSDVGLGSVDDIATGTTSGTIPVLSTGGVLPIARLATGSPTGSKFVRDDGTLAIPPGGGGTGDVVGPASSVDNAVTRFDATTGKLIQTSPVTISDAGKVSGVIAGTAGGDVVEYAQMTTALAGKEPTITGGSTAQYLRGDKSLATLNADVVPDGTTNKAYTATEKTKLSGVATGATANQSDATTNAAIAAAQAASQPLDSDLTTIAGLTPTTNNMIQSVGSAWASRTPTQVKAALAIANTDVSGLGTASTVNTGTTSGTIPLLSTGGVLPIARLATGTPDGTKFVRDDGTLVTPSGGSATPTAVTQYTTAQTNTVYPIPAGAKMLRLRVQGSGGGGGSGRRGASLSVRCGGAGGAAGGYTEWEVSAAALATAGFTQLYVTVGGGGTGGGGRTTDDTSGVSGTDGATSSVSTSTVNTLPDGIAVALGGAHGGGGTTANGFGGAGGVGRWSGATSPAASATGGVGVTGTNGLSAPGAGGTGGGLTSADAQSTGGAGAIAGGFAISFAAGGTAGGGNGGSGVTATAILAYGGSGAGGGSRATGGAAGNGGDAGLGAGGGGGGASLNGNNSGAGGAGGVGFVEITAYF